MTASVTFMYGVALVLGVVGAVLLLRLRGPLTELQVYACRIAGVMCVAAAILLGASATAMWQWSPSL